MRQKLFTKQIDDMLFKQYAMGNDLSKQKVVAKIFNPYGRGTYYLLNSDPSDPDYIWAIVDLFEIEVGSVSRESLEMMKVPPFGLNLERDIYFQPINASELLNRLYQGEKFADGGGIKGVYEGSVRRINGKDYLIDESVLNNLGDIVGWNAYEVVYDNKMGEKHINYERTKKNYNRKYFKNNINLLGNDVGFEYFADGGELQIIKNESGENYLANVGSTPNEMAVKLANGGSIPNNYRGRTTEDIWNSLTENQRVHFMFDHFDELGVKENEIVGIANKEYKDLNEDVQGAFKTHTMMGQYANGGKLSSYDRGVVREDMEKFVSIAKTSKDGKDFIDKARKITNVNPTTSSWFFERYDDLDMNKASDKFVKEVKDGTFDVEKIYAKGGKIKNQYEGRTPEDIWNNLSKEQRSHFIYDHAEAIQEYRGEEYGELSSKEIIKAYNSDYKDLDKNIRNRFDNHTREGQYRMGGEIKVVEGDMIKSKNVKGKVYYASGTMFKLEDEYGNKNPKYFSTRDFKKSEIIKMAKGGMVVTSIKDIPNFKERLDEGKITYRGLGLGKLFDDFYDIAGESGTRIKVDGKEYFITDTEFKTFSRGSDGKLIIKFDAPYRKSYANGGMTNSNNKAKSLAKNILKKKS